MRVSSLESLGGRAELAGFSAQPLHLRQGGFCVGDRFRQFGLGVVGQLHRPIGGRRLQRGDGNHPVLVWTASELRVGARRFEHGKRVAQRERSIEWVGHSENWSLT